MTFGVSKTVQEIVLKEMIENEVETVTRFGITFGTEKKETSLPTGLMTKDGMIVYIQA